MSSLASRKSFDGVFTYVGNCRDKFNLVLANAFNMCYTCHVIEIRISGSRVRVFDMETQYIVPKLQVSHHEIGEPFGM